MRNSKQVEELYLKYEHLVPATLNKRFTNHHQFAKIHGLDVEDLLQIGRMGLLLAAQNYDASKGSQFQTYAINHICYSITDKAREYSLHSKNRKTYEIVSSVSIETPVANGEEDCSLHETLESISEDYNDADMRVAMEGLEDVLPERVMEIVRLRMADYTFKEIGKEFGISVQRVRQLLENNKDKIYKTILA